MMNGWPLPAGPLREPVARLREVDALVLNGPCTAAVAGVPVFRMDLAGGSFYRHGDPAQRRTAAERRRPSIPGNVARNSLIFSA